MPEPLVRNRTFRHAFLAACAVVCIGAPGARAAAVRVLLQPSPSVVAAGDTFVVEIAVLAADSVFNAFDAHVLYDSSRVAFVPVSPVAAQIGSLMISACANRFHLFTPGPTQLDITCSLLCNQVFVNGPGVVYRLKFRAKDSPGAASFTLGAATRFYKAGVILLPLEVQNASVTITGTTGVGEPPPPARALRLEAPFPNPASSAEPVTLAFTLAEPGPAALDVFDVRGRRVGGLAARDYSQGRNAVTLRFRRLPPGIYRVRLTAAHGGQESRVWVVVD